MFGWISLMMRKSAQICMIPTVCTVAGSAINRQKPTTVNTARQKTEHIWPMDPKDRATFLRLSMDSCAKQPVHLPEGSGRRGALSSFKENQHHSV